MSNIQFGSYTPPPPPEDIINISLGIFFDGTLNNKTNTDARKGKLKDDSAYKKYGGDQDDNTSYNNDWSNVARLWDNYKKSESIYVEGIGTKDLQEDVRNGYAFGTGETGIKAKVKLGCEKIALKIKKVKNNSPKSKISKVTLNVFGFSRGAAAARNFVYEVSKIKKEEKFGILGEAIKNLGINIEDLSIDVRFLGIFDTVSSYSEKVSLKPNFSNDIEELHLDNISKAKKIVHFVAANEIRENFDLTDLKTYSKTRQKSVYLGTEKNFPGVHCDIGGSYENGIEIKDEIINGKSSVLNKKKEQLIAEGWFKKEQLIVHEIRGKLSSKRELKKSYSYIPLHFMAEYGIENKAPLDKSQIVNVKYSISGDSLLIYVKNRLKDYVLGNGSYYDFKWFSEIQNKYKGIVKTDPKYKEYKEKFVEQKKLRQLRNEYLHWSADYDWVGMDPRPDGVRIKH